MPVLHGGLGVVLAGEDGEQVRLCKTEQREPVLVSHSHLGLVIFEQGGHLVGLDLIIVDLKYKSMKHKIDKSLKSII